MSKSLVDRTDDLSLPAVNVNKTEARKIKRYEKEFRALDGRVAFSPFGISTFGAMGYHAKRVLAILVKETTKTRLIPAEIAHFYISRVLVGYVLSQIGLGMSQALAMV